MKLKVVSSNVVSKEVYLEGMKLDVLDFGNLKKSNINTKDLTVAEMNFQRRDPDDEVLEKYNIDLGSYNIICNKLEQEIQSVLF